MGRRLLWKERVHITATAVFSGAWTATAIQQHLFLVCMPLILKFGNGNLHDILYRKRWFIYKMYQHERQDTVNLYSVFKVHLSFSESTTQPTAQALFSFKYICPLLNPKWIFLQEWWDHFFFFFHAFSRNVNILKNVSDLYQSHEKWPLAKHLPAEFNPQGWTCYCFTSVHKRSEKHLERFSSSVQSGFYKIILVNYNLGHR